MKENIIIGLQATDRNDAIMKIVQLLVTNGHVKETYYDSVVAREEIYPTGLPTEGVRIAIPHASSEDIIESTIGMAILETPVVFNNMADDSEELDVKIVFLIANAASTEQPKILKQLMEKFSDEDLLISLSESQSAEVVMDLIGS
ncbi:MAG: PTS sugar transporter subunit IIA [Dethiosulfatibacter sp.]|nr:PTS sugar transporter subunit IIA [Dethiosulfatibacter sp.]